MWMSFKSFFLFFIVLVQGLISFFFVILKGISEECYFDTVSLYCGRWDSSNSSWTFDDCSHEFKDDGSQWCYCSKAGTYGLFYVLDFFIYCNLRENDDYFDGFDMIFCRTHLYRRRMVSVRTIWSFSSIKLCILPGKLNSDGYWLLHN